MPFSSFSGFCAGFRFSNQQPAGRRIYDAIASSAGIGESWAEGGYEDSHLVATAMALGRCQYAIERAGNQRLGARATDLLRALESSYGPTPSPSDSLDDRRAAVAVRQRIPGGGREDNVLASLTAILGDDLVSYRSHSDSEQSGEAASSFVSAKAPTKVVSIDDGLTASGGIVWTRFTHLHGEAIETGDILNLSPGTSRAESVAVTVRGNTLGATVSYSHDAGAFAATGRLAQWSSYQRHHTVILKPTAATNRRTRERVHDLLRRLLRGTATWSLLVETDPGAAGPFLVGESPIGLTPVVEI